MLKLSPSVRTELAWLLPGLALVALLGLPALIYPLGVDQAIFALVGERWLAGGVPYRDAWDIKPPGVFAIYAAAMALFGHTMAAPRIADLLAALAAGGLLFLLARRRLSPPGAFLTVAWFGVAYWIGFDYWNTAQVEGFAAPVSLFYVYALLRGRESADGRWWAAAGGCLGLLVLLKTTYAGFGLLALAALWPVRDAVPACGSIWKRVCTGLLLFAAGAAGPLALTVLYFALNGAADSLAELLAAQAGYSSGLEKGLSRRAAAVSLQFFTDPALLLGTLLAGASLLLPGCRKLKDTGMLWAWLVTAAALVVLQRRFYWYHWLPLLPPLALLTGASLEALRSRFFGPGRGPAERRGAFGFTAAALGIVLAPAALAADRFGAAWGMASGRLPAAEYWKRFDHENGYSYRECLQAAEYVRARTGPGDAIFIYDCEPTVYFLARRVIPTRHLSTTPILVTTNIPAPLRARWHNEMLADVAARPPRYLIAWGGMVDSRKTVNLANLRFDLETVCGKLFVYRRAGSPEAQARSARL